MECKNYSILKYNWKLFSEISLNYQIMKGHQPKQPIIEKYKQLFWKVVDWGPYRILHDFKKETSLLFILTCYCVWLRVTGTCCFICMCALYNSVHYLSSV